MEIDLRKLKIVLSVMLFSQPMRSTIKGDLAKKSEMI